MNPLVPLENTCGEQVVRSSTALATVLLCKASQMKAFMILGALVGFLIGAGFSFASHAPYPVMLSRACVGAVALALLARWWGAHWMTSLRQALDDQARKQSSAARGGPANGKV